MTGQQWRLMYGGLEVGPFETPEQTGPIVDGLRNAWAVGELATSTVTVQVSSADGWKTYEYIDFAEETAA